MSAIAKVFATLIKSGKQSIADVPEKIREEVEQILQEDNHEENNQN